MVAMYSRPPAAAMPSQTGGAGSLYSASLLPSPAAKAARIPPFRPSHAPWGSFGSTISGSPATKIVSPARTMAVTRMLMRCSHKGFGPCRRRLAVACLPLEPPAGAYSGMHLSR